MLGVVSDAFTRSLGVADVTADRSGAGLQRAKRVSECGLSSETCRRLKAGTISSHCSVVIIVLLRMGLPLSEWRTRPAVAQRGVVERVTWLRVVVRRFASSKRCRPRYIVDSDAR